MIPVPVSFAGMPNTRWWAFEDAKTNYGDIDANTTDLAKLLFLEFALVYANDWFVIPYTLPAGAIATVRGLAVTNTFGERSGSRPPTRGPTPTGSAGACSPSTSRARAGAPADTSLLLLPTAAKVEHGPPIEDVMLIRDEVANMVWGVETIVPLPSGESRPGRRGGGAVARLLPGAGRRPAVAATAGPRADPLPGDEQRARELDSLPAGARRRQQPRNPAAARGDAADPRRGPEPARQVQPRTALLRQGLDDTAAAALLHPRRGGAARRARACSRASSGRAGATGACSCGCACAARRDAAKARAGCASTSSSTLQSPSADRV